MTLNTLKLNNLERLVYRLLVNDIGGTSEDDNYWSMQLDSLATITASSDDQLCPVIVKMSGIAAVKEKEEKWFSNSFYTHDKGYKMCLCVDTADFDDKDSSDDGSDDDSDSSSYLAVLLFLMKGPHDDELTWPLRGKFDITLLNQTSDSEHHSDIVYFDEDTPTGAVYRVMDDD